MPYRDAQNTLLRAVNSVLKQTHSNLELLLIDDGSTDNSATLVAKITDPRIVHLSTSGIGQAGATNLGIERASGDYILFLDSDDELHCDKLELQLTSCYTEKELANALSISLADLQDGQPALKELLQLYSTEAILPHELKRRLLVFCFSVWCIPNAAFLIPNTCSFRAIRYTPNLCLDNNYDYFSRLIMAADQVLLSDRGSVVYHVVPNSLSRTRSDTASRSAILARYLTAHQYIRYFGVDHREDTRPLFFYLLVSDRTRIHDISLIRNICMSLGLRTFSWRDMYPGKLRVAMRFLGLYPVVIYLYIQRRLKR